MSASTRVPEAPVARPHSQRSPSRSPSGAYEDSHGREPVVSTTNPPSPHRGRLIPQSPTARARSLGDCTQTTGSRPRLLTVALRALGCGPSCYEPGPATKLRDRIVGPGRSTLSMKGILVSSVASACTIRAPLGALRRGMKRSRSARSEHPVHRTGARSTPPQSGRVVRPSYPFRLARPTR